MEAAQKSPKQMSQGDRNRCELCGPSFPTGHALWSHQSMVHHDERSSSRPPEDEGSSETEPEPERSENLDAAAARPARAATREKENPVRPGLPWDLESWAFVRSNRPLSKGRSSNGTD